MCTVSEDGSRVFFDNDDALVPEDVDGVEDVYEWEADGEWSCSSISQDEGCLYLISSGRSSERSHLGGASANRDDVFFFISKALQPGPGHGTRRIRGSGGESLGVAMWRKSWGVLEDAYLSSKAGHALWPSGGRPSANKWRLRLLVSGLWNRICGNVSP